MAFLGFRHVRRRVPESCGQAAFERVRRFHEVVIHRDDRVVDRPRLPIGRERLTPSLTTRAIGLDFLRAEYSTSVHTIARGESESLEHCDAPARRALRAPASAGATAGVLGTLSIEITCHRPRQIAKFRRRTRVQFAGLSRPGTIPLPAPRWCRGSRSPLDAPYEWRRNGGGSIRAAIAWAIRCATSRYFLHHRRQCRWFHLTRPRGRRNIPWGHVSSRGGRRPVTHAQSDATSWS